MNIDTINLLITSRILLNNNHSAMRCSWDGRREISQSRRPMKWVPPPDQLFFFCNICNFITFDHEYP